MKKQVMIIGLGRFGISLAKALYDMGHDVLAVDTDLKKVQGISSEITHAVQADATNEAVLRDLGASKFDVAVVAVGETIQNSVLSTILLKKLGVPYVVARAENELHGSILEKIGADKVIYVESEMGTRVANSLTLTNVLDHISIAPKYGVSKLAAPKRFSGKNLSDIGLGRAGKLGISVLLIQREKEVIITPDRSETIKPNDVLIVAGENDKLEQLLATPNG